MDKELLDKPLSRRQCLTGLGGIGLGFTAAGVLSGCGGSGLGASGDAAQDRAILTAAVAAEALATVMYWNLLKSTIYTSLGANPSDQAYLVAAYEQELNHYNQLISYGTPPVASGTNFYFPAGMFTDKQTTVNTLVTLEDTFIAAYLIGVRDFGSNTAKQLAAEILGVESEHRVLARIVASDLGLTSTTGQSGNPESVVPPSHTVNNIAYERTFASKFPNINGIVAALDPFLTAGTAGFGTTAYVFDATVMTLPVGITPVTLDNTVPTKR